MVRLGPYKQVFEAHRDSFLKAGYSEVDSSVLAQAIVATPLPDTAFGRPAGYFEAAIPAARLMLEFNTFEGVSLKINEFVQANPQLFSDKDDPGYLELIVSGVYPGNPGLLVVKAENTDCWYAADWSISDSGDVSIANVRDIGTYYETLTIAVTEGLQQAFDLALWDKETPLAIEQSFLKHAILGREYIAPEIVLDGTRPVEEMEFVKFLRNSKVLTESFATPFQLKASRGVPEVKDAVGRLAMAIRHFGIIEAEAELAKKLLKPKYRRSATTEARDDRAITEAGDLRNIGGHTVHVDDKKAAKGNFDHVSKQIETHNEMRDALKGEDFQKRGNYGTGEEHEKDAKNGYHVKVTLAGGKAHTTVHRNGGGPIIKAVGTASTAENMLNHVNIGMSAAASAPNISGYES